MIRRTSTLLMIFLLIASFLPLIIVTSKPVQASPETFGYETIGTYDADTSHYIRGSVFTITESGTADSITAYVKTWADYSDAEVVFGIYKHSDLSFVGMTEIWTIGTTASQTLWKTLNFTEPKPSLVADTAYVLVGWGDDESWLEMHYDTTGEANQGHATVPDGSIWEYGTPPDFPDPVTFNHNNYLYSIYCTYTAGAPLPPPPIIYIYPPEVYVATTWTVAGETVKVSALVLDENNDPITGLPSDNVNYDLWSPESNLVAENIGLTETSPTVSAGLYENSWTFGSTDNLGTWTVYVAVDAAGTTSYSIAHIRLEPSITRIEGKVDWIADYLENTIKLELDNIEDNMLYVKSYLTGTIKPQLDAMKENIDKTLDNAVEIYSYLTGTVKPVIDDTYDQTVTNYNYLTGTIKPQLDNIQENLSVTAELPENVMDNIFATYSFLTENIKPELDNVYENVNASYSYLINTINLKLDEIAAGVGVGLSIEVTRYYQLSAGDLQEFYVTIGKGTNVDWVTITLEDPKSTLVVDNSSMSNPEIGSYYYSFSTSDREPGGWLATIVAKEENLTTTYRGVWRLRGVDEAVGYLTLTILDNETTEIIEGVKIELYKAGTLVESKYTQWDGRAFLDVMNWGIHELKWSKSGYGSEVIEIDLAVSSELTLRMIPTKKAEFPFLYIFVAIVIGAILVASVYYGSKKRAKIPTLLTLLFIPVLSVSGLWLVGWI